ncbi:conjugal transfer protein TraE [Clostridia bacterium]|nr:conjugal transfer protein TraE [Clostridia bacterium]
MPKSAQAVQARPQNQTNKNQGKTLKTKGTTPQIKQHPPLIDKFLQKLFGEAVITTQETIQYKQMYKDGICRVKDNFYTKTVQFFDINYQLAQNDDKTQIFESYCDFLNYFDSSVSVQLSFVNQTVDIEEFKRSIDIPQQQDKFNDIRKEYTEMLNNQLSKGNNGLVKTKFITFGIEADNLKIAKPKLERIEMDVLNNFKVLGVKAHPLDGIERLRLFHGNLNTPRDKFQLDNWDTLVKTGNSTKDYISPVSFDFRSKNSFKIGDKFGSASFLQILAPELPDRILADFLDIESSMILTIHIQSVDHNKAIKYAKGKLSDVRKMKIEDQKKAVRSGYDMDALSPDIITYENEANNLLEDLQSRNERMINATILLVNFANSKQKLDNDFFQASGIAQKFNCSLRRLDFQQENSLMSSLPIGKNFIDIERGLTTSSTAIFVPFTTQELFQSHSEALYYGLNALSNNLIIVDKKLLKNPNTLILGTPGSGKSFAAKREITNVFLSTLDDILICDPEGEFGSLVGTLDGQIIKISQNSRSYINPMDINLDYSDDDDPISLKSDFILSLCELIVGGRNGLEATEKTVIDRCLRLVYQDYLANPVPENMPILGDLYNLLMNQAEQEARRVATALEIYVNGSLNVFNHQTNIDINNRIVCFDIKELGKQLKKIGMLIVVDCVWNKVTINRGTGKSTRLYIDEFHLLLKEEQTSSYSVEIWKRFRKWGGIPTGITQNVKDLLASREIENIFENSDFIIMLNQAAGDRQILAKQLGISPYQLSYVTHTNEGEGLLFYGNVIIPFVDKFPKDTKLYKVMTTKLSEVADAKPLLEAK